MLSVIVHVDVYVPAVVEPGRKRPQLEVTDWEPIPLPALASKKLVAVGAVVPAGSGYGYVVWLEGSEQVEPEAQAAVGAAAMETDVVGRVTAGVPLVVNVVEVALKCHPAPEPVASVTVNACGVVTV